MEEVNIAQASDLVVVVGGVLRLRVSSAVLKKVSYFRNLLVPPSGEGTKFEKHKAKNKSILYELKFDRDEPIGMKLLCDALHGRHRFIPRHFDPETVLSFARMVDKCRCTKEVKDAAGLALESLTMEHINTQPLVWLRAAFLFDHAECFSVYTDYISKYVQTETTEMLQDLRTSDRLHGLHDLLKRNQRRVEQIHSRSVSDLAAELADHYDVEYDHVEAHHNGDTARRVPNETDEADLCNMHHLAVMECHRKLITGGLWRYKIWERPLYGFLLQARDPPLPPPAEQFAGCTTAESMLLLFSEGLEELQESAERTWAGVCLPCFKAGGRDEPCRHLKPTAHLVDEPMASLHL